MKLNSSVTSSFLLDTLITPSMLTRGAECNDALVQRISVLWGQNMWGMRDLNHIHSKTQTHLSSGQTGSLLLMCWNTPPHLAACVRKCINIRETNHVWGMKGGKKNTYHTHTHAYIQIRGRAAYQFFTSLHPKMNDEGRPTMMGVWLGTVCSTRFMNDLHNSSNGCLIFDTCKCVLFSHHFQLYGRSDVTIMTFTWATKKRKTLIT